MTIFSKNLGCHGSFAPPVYSYGNEVRWGPGQEANLVPPWSNLRSFGSKCTTEESTCDIVSTFQHSHPAPRWRFVARGIVPSPPHYAPVRRAGL